MTNSTGPHVHSTAYDRSNCDVGVVHLGYGAFHRAHQAVYLDDYMDQTGDLRWGIAAVNLRAEESQEFARNKGAENGYILKSVAPNSESTLRRVRSHLNYLDWSKDPAKAESMLARSSVHVVTITVTESGYYGDTGGLLDPEDKTIAAELAGGETRSVYAYLTAGLDLRRTELDQPISVLCCDNIQQNGKKLRINLMAYLTLAGKTELSDWVDQNVTFPCSMVDRITPRATDDMRNQVEAAVGKQSVTPVMAEKFMQWVLEGNFAGPVPQLDKVGVTIADDVDPYEEAKIRILNGGHTCLTYLAALKGIETFDAAMCDPELRDHFISYETQEVLVALTRELPFDKSSYLAEIAARFENQAIGDTIARICADGMAKFPIFIRPTLAGCLKQGKMPTYGIQSVASWFVFAKQSAAGRIPFSYVEPSWAKLEQMLEDPTKDSFVQSKELWGDLPETYPEFALKLRASIEEAETKWLV
ncbi:mannitol-1-phosphate 5-dehydrogenase [Rhodobacterales bacterium 56_14_T64]|nr:mannitol-1-phosphate 5-dehydrogenase [Rhodobacterales bacterium 56_14_T64]